MAGPPRSQNASAPITPVTSPPLIPDKSPNRPRVPDSIPSAQAQQLEQSVPAPSFSRPFPPQRPQFQGRSHSNGTQLVPDGGAGDSEVIGELSILPAPEGYGGKDAKGGNAGMLSFLNRKKGREKSPRPKDPGILGKIGARQIIG